MKYAGDRARILFGSFRTGEANDPKVYAAAVAATLAKYPEDVIKDVTRPEGLPRQQNFLPLDKNRQTFHPAHAEGNRRASVDNLEGARKLDWVIVGGESGPGARPAHPDWIRSLRDQCAEAGVSFFFKQWASSYPYLDRDKEDPGWRADYGRASRAPEKFRILNLAGGCGFQGERVHLIQRHSKAQAGRVLDGATHSSSIPEAPR